MRNTRSYDDWQTPSNATQECLMGDAMIKDTGKLKELLDCSHWFRCGNSKPRWTVYSKFIRAKPFCGTNRSSLATLIILTRVPSPTRIGGVSETVWEVVLRVGQLTWWEDR